jgi:hypothetical protein
MVNTPLLITIVQQTKNIQLKFWFLFLSEWYCSADWGLVPSYFYFANQKDPHARAANKKHAALMPNWACLPTSWTFGRMVDLPFLS